MGKNKKKFFLTVLILTTAILAVGLVTERIIKNYSKAQTEQPLCAERIDICSVSNYAVETTFSFPPTAAISCDVSGCQPTSDCVGYIGGSNPSCVFVLKNDSTDPDGQEDIVKSEWDILNWGESPDHSCSGLCDFVPTNWISTPGDYTVELRVEDSQGASDSTTKNISVKQDAVAGFSCSLDNENWQDCSNFQVSAGEVVYFSDNQPDQERSSPSEGAIISRTWEVVETGRIFNQNNNSNASTTLVQGENTVKLTIIDSVGRSDYQTHYIGVTIGLPKWREIEP